MTAQLRGGRMVTVRPIRPEDKDGLHAAVLSLSDDSRYTRFMAAKRELSSQTLHAATNPKPAQEFALVAVDESGSIVGGARYASAPDSDSCEFAITIADDWQGIGLARHLMEILMRTARRAGFETMEGYVLAGNAAMRGLAKRLGFDDKSSPDDPGVRLVTRKLQPPAVAAP
ncbi:MAG TPA: GNAT family N-acetyltransferase [Burkholderiaceae bacterium]|nr:GNAT family N-acetyltransferase [Burkholderiaceae bacterium]